MKFLKLSLSVAAVLWALCMSAQQKPFSFVQISDPQLGFYDDNKSISRDSLQLEEAVRHINRIRPAFVVVTGDMVNSSKSIRQINAYKGIISKVDRSIPVYHIPGNHDVGKCSKESLDFYRQNYGDDRFSFRYGDCAFIGINSSVIKDGFEPEMNTQYRWLEKELKKAGGCTCKFVFTHCSVFLSDFDEKENYSNFSVPDRQLYWELFKKYNVSAVIAGHLHNSSRGSRDGIEMVTAGPVGRPLGKGVSGIALWNVDGDDYSCSYIPLGSFPVYGSLNGLVMAGYQGWFNAEGDGAGLGWKHYKKDDAFCPGSCTIDLWPDVSEYEDTYETAFVHKDGKPARVFSSHDASTVDLHFRWMKEYGIDGAFMQRFVTSIRSEKGKDNYNDILMNAASAAEKYDRAFCVMYDLSGINSSEVDILMDDWKELSGKYRIALRENNHYLYHNGKPLVAVWGVGFDDRRKYDYDDIARIVDFLRSEGCSILLGVPAHWRTLAMDAMADPRLHDLIRKADVVHPWFVGRFNNDSYPSFSRLVEEDIKWCEEYGLDYIPVLFPGFSWYNLKGGVAAPLNQIPRLGGAFFWQQVYRSVSYGAKSLYLAMFDEIDEGTAFFKCTDDVPAGESPFLTYEGCEPDRYLWLAGEAGKVLRGESPLSQEMPVRK